MKRMDIPHAPDAEAAFLGACLLSRSAVDVLATDLAPTDFYIPLNRDIATAILDLRERGDGIDVRTVSDLLAGQGQLGVSTREALIAYIAEVPATRNAATYAATVRDRASRRSLLGVLYEALDRTVDLSRPLAGTIDELRAGEQNVIVPLSAEIAIQDISELLAEMIDYQWLVPGLLERGDRVIITGPEGEGKSHLLRQVAVMLAAGIHPFSLGPVPPVSVLIVDVENSRLQVQRQLRPLYEKVRVVQPALENTGFDPRRLHVAVHPRGLDLLTTNDRGWLAAQMQASRPDVLITGPLYKMHRGNPNDESEAARLAAFLDDLRDIYRCALIIEAHSPHGERGDRPLRPRGASLWMGWPEFGYGLHRPAAEEFAADPALYELKKWRGPRDHRSWPQRLRKTRPPSWPWRDTNHNPDGKF